MTNLSHVFIVFWTSYCFCVHSGFSTFRSQLHPLAACGQVLWMGLAFAWSSRSWRPGAGYSSLLGSTIFSIGKRRDKSGKKSTPIPWNLCIYLKLGGYYYHDDKFRVPRPERNNTSSEFMVYVYKPKFLTNTYCFLGRQSVSLLTIKMCVGGAILDDLFISPITNLKALRSGIRFKQIILKFGCTILKVN